MLIISSCVLYKTWTKNTFLFVLFKEAPYHMPRGNKFMQNSSVSGLAFSNNANHHNGLKFTQCPVLHILFYVTLFFYF